MPGEDDRSGEVRLPSGRTLSYACFGIEDGPTVVVLDGAGSRMQARAAHKIAERVGVRLIAPDRPGFGRSSPDPSGTLLTFADDVTALTTALNIERLGMWCQSAGAPFALACAYRLRDRITHLGILAGIGPLDAPGAFDGMNMAVRLSFHAARRFPSLIELQFRALAAINRRSPEHAARVLIASRPPRDRAVLSGPQWPTTVAAMGELTQSPAATAREFRLMAQPWGFDLAAVRVPTTIWQGTADTVHPPSMARFMASRIPDATLHLEPGLSTFDFLDRRDEMLRTVAPSDAATG